MPSSPVARRYGAAAFALAREQEAVNSWRSELSRLDQLFRDEKLRVAFHNPAVSSARRLQVAERVSPELKPQTRNLLRLLVEHQRTPDVSAIREEFERLADGAAGIVHALLTTPIELSAEEQERYRAALGRKFGRAVNLRVEVDPALIGGARIQVGDHLVDGSVRTKLEQLRQALRS